MFAKPVESPTLITSISSNENFNKHLLVMLDKGMSKTRRFLLIENKSPSAYVEPG